MARSRSVGDWLSGHPIFGRTMGPNREPPRVRLTGGSKVKMGKRSVRSDGTKMTVKSLGQRRRERHAKNARAKAARRRNRVR